MENWVFCLKQLCKSLCTECFPCNAADQYFPLFWSDMCSEIVPSTGPNAQMRRVVTPTVCTYPVRECTRVQQLLHSFPLHSHNSTASTGCICIMTLVRSSRKKTHFFRQETQAQCKNWLTPSSPGSTSTNTNWPKIVGSLNLDIPVDSSSTRYFCGKADAFSILHIGEKNPVPLRTEQGRNTPALCLQFPCREAGAVRKFRMVNHESDEIIRRRFL